MSLLSIVNAAQSLLNLPVTTTVVTNNGEAQRQLLQLANQEGRSLARSHAWQNLTTEETFTTVATEEQTGHTLPTDLGWIVDETLYDRTTTERVTGPLTSKNWQSQKAFGAIIADPQYRLRGNSFWFLPAPAAGDTVAYEYVSKNWCETSGGTDQEYWQADTDVGKIDEYVMTLGIVWRWLKSKGHAYEQDWNDYQTEKMRAIARDGTRKTLSMVGPTRGRTLGTGNIPEGSWS